MKSVVIIVVKESYKNFLCFTRCRVIITVKGFIFGTLRKTFQFPIGFRMLNASKYLLNIKEILKELPGIFRSELFAPLSVVCRYHLRVLVVDPQAVEQEKGPGQPYENIVLLSYPGKYPRR